VVLNAKSRSVLAARRASVITATSFARGCQRVGALEDHGELPAEALRVGCSQAVFGIREDPDEDPIQFIAGGWL
jgi:hypothetical protein